MIKEKFGFLYSNRFWAVVLGAIVLYLNEEAIINDNLTILLETIITSFVGIRTVDRLGEKIGGTKNKK